MLQLVETVSCQDLIVGGCLPFLLILSCKVGIGNELKFMKRYRILSMKMNLLFFSVIPKGEWIIYLCEQTYCGILCSFTRPLKQLSTQVTCTLVQTKMMAMIIRYFGFLLVSSHLVHTTCVNVSRVENVLISAPCVDELTRGHFIYDLRVFFSILM